jgi:hypothetical protein
MSTTVQRILVSVVLVIAVLLVVRSLTASPEQSYQFQSIPGPAIVAPPQIDSSQLRLPLDLAIPVAPGEAVPSTPDATWASVAEFSGQEAGRTPTFELSGSPARVRYKIDGDMQFLAVFFVPEGQNQASAFPDLISTNQSEGEATIAKPAGSYYLTVQTINGGWSVAVDEEQIL